MEKEGRQGNQEGEHDMQLQDHPYLMLKFPFYCCCLRLGVAVRAEAKINLATLVCKKMDTSGSSPAQPNHNWCQSPPASKRFWGGKGSTEKVPTMPPIWKTQRRHPLTSLVTRGTPKCQKWSFSSPLYTTFPKRAMLPVLHSPFPGLVSAEGEKKRKYLEQVKPQYTMTRKIILMLEMKIGEK